VEVLAALGLGVRPAAHRRKLFLGEGYSAATSLTRNLDEGRSHLASRLRFDLDEAEFDASCNLAGKLRRSLMTRI
jgi:hypothetical protein